MEYPFKDLLPREEATARQGYYKDWTHIDADTFHQISELVKFIREKGYGTDTREAIAQALERVYHDAAMSGNANMEVSMARKHFKDLASRLNASDNKLSSATAQVIQTDQRVDNLILNPGDGSTPAELVDARVVKHRIHKVAGDSVRSVSDGFGVQKTAVGENLYNPSSDVIEDKIAGSDGVISNANGWRVAKIPIEPSTAYDVWMPTGIYSAVIGSIIFTDLNDNVLSFHVAPTTIGFVYQGVTSRRLTSPSNSAFIYVNVTRPDWQSTPYDVKDTFKLFKGNPNDGYISGLYNLMIKDTEAHRRLDELENPKSHDGIRWGAVGDSLTEINSRSTKFYHQYVADDIGIEVVNLGISGTGYKRTDESGTAFYQRVSAIPVNLDVVTIFGSGNDLGAGVPLGVVSDTGTDTVAGAINTTLDNLIDRLPTVPIGIITPTPWNDMQPNTDNTMRQYADLLIEIAKSRGLPYLDLYRSSGLRPWDTSYRVLMYSRDGGNGVHPDENGHKLFYPQIREFVKKLV